MAPHLVYLTKKLLELERRAITRLIIEAPPRHGKSQLCSIFFPAWYLGRNPTHRVMVASEESNLAFGFSEKIRNTIKLFGPSVFGVTLHPKRTRRDHWQLENEVGGLYASGRKGGGLTGRGSHLLVVDDPIRNAKDAMSVVTREAVWSWFLSTARSRLQREGLIVIIQTRWHQDDLVGRLLKYQPGVWTRVRLPALAEAEGDPLGRTPGQPLWPEIMPLAMLEEYRKSSTYWWQAMYQQDPTPEGGLLAQRRWFKLVAELPRGVAMRRCRFWDCAGTEASHQSDPDWTVGALLAQDLDSGLFYIEHIQRVRRSPGEVDRLIRETAAFDGPDVAIREEREPGSSGIAVIDERKRKLAGYNYDGVKPRGKPVSWMPLLVQAESGNVRLKNGPWVDEFLAEVDGVPFSTHDDQMDAVSGAFTELAGMPQFAIPGLVW